MFLCKFKPWKFNTCRNLFHSRDTEQEKEKEPTVVTKTLDFFMQSQACSLEESR